ncbi:MAG: hypothetical protein AMXMBFR64_14480 [Myxococcales bacterium]
MRPTTWVGLTDHARERLAARGITLDAVLLTVSLGRRLRLGPNAVHALRIPVKQHSARRARQLVVIVGADQSVVTAWWGEPPTVTHTVPAGPRRVP